MRKMDGKEIHHYLYPWNFYGYSDLYHYVQRQKQNQINPYFIRLLHASNSLPSEIDIYINDRKVVTSFAFSGVTNDFVVPGKFTVTVTKTMKPMEKLWETQIKLTNSGNYTLVITEKIQRPHLVAFQDDRKTIVGRVKLRLIQLSADVSPLSVDSNHGVLFSCVPFAHARFLTLSPCTVPLEIRLTNTEQTLYQVPTISFTAEKVYTLFTVGRTQLEPKFRLLLLEDG
jgi:hypothetical protein